MAMDIVVDMRGGEVQIPGRYMERIVHAYCMTGFVKQKAMIIKGSGLYELEAGVPVWKEYGNRTGTWKPVERIHHCIGKYIQ